MQIQRLIPAILILLVAAASTYPPRIQADSDNKATHITAAKLNALIKTGNAPVIIDVRSSREFQASHVPGAIHLPFWLAFARADEIEAPKDKPVVIYCAHGPRAGIGKAALSLEGFTQIRYLQGHMSGWQKAQLPIEVSEQ
jgi:rhodanese-related sulfurtransferase